MSRAPQNLQQIRQRLSVSLKLTFAFWVFFIVSLRSVPALKAQELDCQVNLNLTALNEQDRVQWQTFVNDVQAYINNNTWTTNFSGEKIHCSFQFNITGTSGSNFEVQLFVTSSRPLYKNDQLTTMARFLDGNVEFPYVRGETLQHGGGFRPLESVIDYYVYIVLALDYDSYQRQGGGQYYQEAYEVATIANGAAAKGWDRQVTAIGTFSRIGYIEDALDANLRAVRDLLFDYNYNVLDLESTKPDQARTNLATIVDSLVSLKKLNSAISRSPFVRCVFEAKYPELADLGRFFPDNLGAYFAKLEYLDPLHDTYYENVKTKLGG
jgi:hypothetical protein